MDQSPLEKARLVFKNREPLPVMFNPAEMTRERFLDHSRMTPIGRHFSETLSMDLFLDSSYWENDNTDIQPFLQALEQAAAPDSKYPHSMTCTFHWGAFSFSGVIDGFTVQYLKFLPNGTPTRARVSLTMAQSPHSFHIPLETPDLNQAREYRAAVDSGLWLAAWQAYEDPALWRTIAKENHIVNPRLVRAGQILRIPAQRKDH
jgi:hypothetical protein